MGLLPPLVDPGPALSPDRLSRYARQLRLPGLDEAAQRRLAAARVLVVGAGGLGSASVPYLAAAGVGTIGIVDDDVVELSNLHRQVAYTLADVGARKAAALAASVRAQDPEIAVHAHDVHADAATLPAILAGYDLVLDGSDNFATRYLTCDAAALSHKPLVWGAILRFAGQVSVSWADAGPTYRDLYPVPPADGEIPTCADAGVLPGVCAVIGALMATEAVKLITGLGEPLIGRVATYDAAAATFREIEYARDPTAPKITAIVDVAGATAPRRAAAAPPVPGPAAPASVSAAAPSAGGDGAASAGGLITPQELAARLAAGTPLQLIDVREPFEAEIAQIPGSELIPLAELPLHLDRVRQDVPVVVYCHLGGRSRHAAKLLRAAGKTGVDDLAGGIEAYAVEVDSEMRRY